MINGRQKLMAWYEQDETCHYWTIYKKKDHANGHYFDTNMKGEKESSFADSKARLEKVLGLIDSGDCIIVCNDKPQLTAKGRRQTEFSLSSFETSAAPAAAGIGAIPAGYITKEEASQIAEEKFNRLIEKRENEELKKKNAELEKENKELLAKSDSGFNKLMDGLGPHIGGIVAELFPAAAKVSGVHGTGDQKLNDNNIEEAEVVEGTATAEVQQAVQAFCEALAELYPEKWLEIIGKLTNTIKSNPSKIKMALNFL